MPIFRRTHDDGPVTILRDPSSSGWSIYQYFYRLSVKLNRVNFAVFSPPRSITDSEAELRPRYRHQFPDPCHVSFTNVSCDARQRRLLPASYTETRFNQVHSYLVLLVARTLTNPQISIVLKVSRINIITFRFVSNVEIKF